MINGRRPNTTVATSLLRRQGQNSVCVPLGGLVFLCAAQSLKRVGRRRERDFLWLSHSDWLCVKAKSAGSTTSVPDQQFKYGSPEIESVGAGGVEGEQTSRVEWKSSLDDKTRLGEHANEGHLHVSTCKLRYLPWQRWAGSYSKTVELILSRSQKKLCPAQDLWRVVARPSAVRD